jgi:hypothetical protein
MTTARTALISFFKLVLGARSLRKRRGKGALLRDAIAAGHDPEARVRVSQLVFGLYTPYPVMFRVMGPKLSEVTP